MGRSDPRLTSARGGITVGACIDRHAPALVHFVILRGDLPHGLQVANAVHAAGESVADRVPHGTIAVALRAAHEQQLREVAGRLEARGIPHRLVIEGDGPHAGQLMAIGVEPTTDRRAVGKVVSALPLAGG